MGHDKLEIDIGTLDRHRIARGLMKSELQKKAGISFGTLSRIYSGEPVSWRTLRALARALGVANPMRLLAKAESAIAQREAAIG